MSTIDPDSFRRACAKFATGITVVTVTDPQGTPYGFTANSFTSVSLDPPLVLVCLSFRSTLISHFTPGVRFAVNILRENQRDLSVRFATRQEDRFAGVPWRRSEAGVPLIESSLAHFQCDLRQIIEAGDHAVFLGEVFQASFSDGDPLIYFNSKYAALAETAGTPI